MILARLSEQKEVLAQQSEALKSSADDGKAPARALELTSSSNSVPVTPAADNFPSTGPTTRPASTSVNQGDNTEEVLQLKLRLAEAQAKLSRLEDKGDAHGYKDVDRVQSQGHGQMPLLAHENIWANEESFSEAGDALATIPPNRSASGVVFNGNFRAPIHPVGIPAPSSEGSNGSSWFGPRNGLGHSFADANNSYSQTDGYRTSDRLTPDSDMFFRAAGGRRGSRFDGRYASPGSISGPFGPGPYNQSIGQYDMGPNQSTGGSSMIPGPQGLGMGTYPSYQPQPMGSALSPHATEFTSSSGWKNEVRPPLPIPNPSITTSLTNSE